MRYRNLGRTGLQATQRVLDGRDDPPAGSAPLTDHIDVYQIHRVDPDTDIEKRSPR
jgi:hypothetical protein